MRFKEFNNSQLRIINSIKEKYSQRYPNGGIELYRYTFDSTLELNDIIYYKNSAIESFNKIQSNCAFFEPLDRKNIKRIDVQLKRDNIFLDLNGFSIVSRIAYNLFKGGNYSQYANISWQPKECLNIAIDFIEDLIHKEYDKLICLYIDRIKWNTLFFEYYLSETNILFDLKNKEMYLMLVRDSS